MTREEIQAEFDAFFEFPGKDRGHVTSVSCRLFAERIAEMERSKHIYEIQRLTTLANTAEKWQALETVGIKVEEEFK